MTDEIMNAHAKEHFKRWLDVQLEEGNLTENQVKDFSNRLDSVIEDAEQCASCKHENISASVSPNKNQESLRDFVTGLEEEVERFRATCKDCGATVTAEVSLSLMTIEHSTNE